MTIIVNAQVPFKEINETIKIVGIGKAGVKIINNLADFQNSKYFDLAVIDTDTETEKISKIKNTFIIGAEWTLGRGCGGDIIKGERAIAHKSNQLFKNFLDNTSLLIITGGFGGGTATGGAPVIARMAKGKNIPVVFIVTIPFAFEGYMKKGNAEKQVLQILRTSNTIIAIPNDLLYSSLDASASFEAAFEMANAEMAKAVIGIAELLRCNNLLPVDLCDLYNVLSKQKAECGIGVGSAEDKNAANRIENALQTLLKSPLLGGLNRIKEADAIIVSITGGSDLAIGEMKYCLDKITNMTGKKTQIITGANTNEFYNNKAQITLLTVVYDKTSEPIVKEEKNLKTTRSVFATKPKAQADGIIIQPDFIFQQRSRGIFSNTLPTLFNGEDLDIPTFQRKDIHLDKGI